MKKIEWDETKNQKNKKKHNLSFENASRAFDDKNRLQYALKSEHEARYMTIAKVFKVIIAVVYTIRNFSFRLISARTARKDERIRYIENSLKKQDENYDKQNDYPR